MLTVSTRSLIQNINEEVVEQKDDLGRGRLCVLGRGAGERQRCVVFHFLPWEDFSVLKT